MSNDNKYTNGGVRHETESWALVWRWRSAWWRRKGGTLAIAVDPDACRSGALPDGAIYFTSYLRTQETGGYVPLARDVDLRTISAGRDIAAELPPCG